MASSSDPLLVDISNAFFTGNYQLCITLSEKIKVNKFLPIHKLPAHHKIMFDFRNHVWNAISSCIDHIWQQIVTVW